MPMLHAEYDNFWLRAATRKPNRLAHSIKGLAGTLGLAEVYISSSRLCSALKVDQTSGGQYLNELGGFYKQTIALTEACMIK